MSSTRHFQTISNVWSTADRKLFPSSHAINADRIHTDPDYGCWGSVRFLPFVLVPSSDVDPQ
jgi:hypothetical protein